MALKKSQRSLRTWTKQKWRTPSGKKSSETGEVYAPAAKIKKLKSTPAGRRKLAAANNCLLYTSPSPRDKRQSRMPSSA